MAISVESRLKMVEDELKDLKATYTIYGGAIKTYVSSSPSFEVPALAETTIRFTPDYPQQDIIITSIYYQLTPYGGTATHNFSKYAYIEPQDGKGYLTIRLPALKGYIEVSVVGTSPGTFTKIS